MKPSVFRERKIDCIYTTRRGTLYQLSDHNRKLLPISSVQVTLTDFLDKKHVFEILEEQKITFKKYLNLDVYENYLTVHSATAQKKILGTNRDDALKLFVNGYKELSIEELIKYAELCQPEVLVSFSEVPEFSTSGQKSNKRAAGKNRAFLEKTLKKFQPMGIIVLAPIIATKFHEVLEESIQKMQKLEPDGYVIQGLNQGESFEDRDMIYTLITKAFGESKIKAKNIVLSSRGEPCDVLHAVYYGINLFETDYPFQCAEKNLALGFNLYDADLEQLNNIAIGAEEQSYSITLDKNIFKQGLIAKVFDLSKETHKLVVAPLIEKCECYTCKNHTQAYIYHLIDCDEMTANVLLTIHNVFTYQKFINYLNQYEQQGKIEKFIQWFMDTQCIEPKIKERKENPKEQENQENQEKQENNTVNV